jgi:tetratricopeptide (TPR) repeat protein
VTPKPRRDGTAHPLLWAAFSLEQVRGWVRQAADRELDARLDQAAADLALARDLDRMRQEAATPVEGRWNPGRVREQYPEVLARHGLDVLEGDLNELVRTIRDSAVRKDIVAALDDWARVEINHPRREHLLRLANRSDEPDPWRQAVRAAVVRRDGKQLGQLVRHTGQGKPTPALVLLLATALGPQSQEATALLRRMQLKQPRDFWVSFVLGSNYDSDEEKAPEAAECYLVAVALRPDSAVVHYNLGAALATKGNLDQAIACFHRAIELDPTLALPHGALGKALYDKGKLDEAIACFHRAIELDPKFAWAHNALGFALATKGNLDQAIACFHRAIELDPKFALAHCNLGQAQMQHQGSFLKAQQSLQRCLDLLEPNDPTRGFGLVWSPLSRSEKMSLRTRASGLLHRCRQLLDADGKLKAFLAGKGAPADAASLLLMAHLAQTFNQLYVSAGRLYRDALARQPSFAANVLVADRYDAACCAALAGCGQGKDASKLTDEQRSCWRGQALDWLRDDLAVLREKLQTDKPADRAAVQQALRHWQKDTDLAGVRDAAALAKLPADEQKAFAQLWADVAELLKKAEGKTK